MHAPIHISRALVSHVHGNEGRTDLLAASIAVALLNLSRRPEPLQTTVLKAQRL